MAKRKHAAALFEVIHSKDKRTSSVRTRSGSAGWSRPSFSNWLRKGAAKTASAEVSSPKAERSRASEGPSLLSRLFSGLANVLPAKPRVAMDLDPDRQIVSFRLSYTTALISAFVVVAFIALAFVVGKHATRRVSPTLADQTTDELRSGPVQPNVLDVGAESPPMAMASGNVSVGHAPAAPPTTPAKPVNTPPQTAKPASWSEPNPPTTHVDINQKRTVGLQYVLIQSFPASEKQMADDACELLNKKGFLCTVEFNTYYAPNWYSVVGAAGFDRTRNSPEYDTYVAKIIQIGQASGKSRFQKFDPKPFKWREIKAVG